MPEIQEKNGFCFLIKLFVSSLELNAMKKSFPVAVMKGNVDKDRSVTFGITGKDTKEQ